MSTTIKCTNTKAIIANILARIASEFDMHDISKACRKYYEDNKVLDDKYNILRNRAVAQRMVYNILDILYKLRD